MGIMRMVGIDDDFHMANYNVSWPCNVAAFTIARIY